MAAAHDLDDVPSATTDLATAKAGLDTHGYCILAGALSASQVDALRTRITEQAEAESLLGGALKQLFALSESYPTLKANENFAQLQEELTTTENKIAFSRQHYNDSAAVYNTARLKFPNNIVAGMFGFKDREYFEIEEPEAREAPKVQF